MRPADRELVARVLAWVMLAAGGALYAVILVRGLWSGRHDNDFKHIYFGMKALLDASSPYPPESLLLQASRTGMPDASLNPYVYLPFTGLSLGWLWPLSPAVASQVWFVVSHLCVVGSCVLIARILFPRRQMPALGLMLAVCAVCHPLARNLTAGQLNAVLLLCYAGAFALLVSRRAGMAGSVLGFAAMFKLSPGLFLVHFAARREWRPLAAMAAMCVVLGLVSLAAVGVGIHLEFLPMLRQMGYGRSTWQEYGAVFWKEPANQSINSLLTHLLVVDNGITTPWLRGSQSLANGLTAAAGALLTLIYLVCATLPRAGRVADPAPAFMAALLLSLLLPSLMWDHYLVQVLLPAAWLSARAIERRSPLIALEVTAAIIIICAPWPYGSDAFREGAGVPLMSVKLLPVLGMFLRCCRECRRTLPTTG
jgi:hypothetical protein